jgi:hypothetical protein
MAHKGIFCLEGDWWNNLKKPSSVEPILELLAKSDGYRVPYVHLNVGDRRSLDLYLAKWTQKGFRDHPILYLAFHGNAGGIQVGDRRVPDNTVTLKALGELLEGKCKNRVIFFGSCETVNVHGKRLNTFLKQTGALAVCGYCGNVDWMLSTAFELLVLAYLQENSLTINGSHAVANKIRSSAKSIHQKLKFKMVIAKSGSAH